MSFRYDSARAWAEEHSLAAPLSLARLETIAFQAHPDIYRHFGDDGAALARTVGAPERSGARRAGSAVLWLLMVVAALAPVAGYAVLVGDRFRFFVMPAERAVPISGICYAIATVALAVALIVWIVRGARWSPLVLGFAIVSALCSISSSWTMRGVSEDAGYDGWQLWQPVVFACAALALLTIVAVLARFRVRDPEPQGGADDDIPAGSSAAAVSEAVGVADIRRQVFALPRDEQAAILADRNAALDVLHERGLLDAEMRDSARTRELGTLYLLDSDPAKGAL